MDLSAYLLPLRKWWWLILAATLVAGVSSFIASTRQKPVYQSTTTLLIGSSIEDPNPSTGELTLAQQLAEIYADIAKRETVRNATREALGLDGMPQYTAVNPPKSQIVEISVLDTIPIRAQAVAQELANQLIQQSPTGSDSEDQARIDFINEQLDQIQTQIEETQAQIEENQNQLGELNSALQIQEMEQQINGLQSKLNTLQSNYANLIANTQQGATNILTIIEPANLPRVPVNQNTALTILLAAAVGFSLATLAAFLLEYLDSSVKTPEEAMQIFQTSVLGYIPQFQNGVQEGPYVIEHPTSVTAEAFRSLRIGIELAAAENPLKTILVTSADPSAGKTTVSVNLAITLAQGGHKVLLLDADLRRPSIHTYLGTKNSTGLTSILKGESDVHGAIQGWDAENLEVITAGKNPPNPAELVNTPIMDEALAEMRDLAGYVVIDAPPILIADSSTLASKVDGILLVIQPGKTNRNLAQSVEDQVKRIGTPVIGIIFNRISKKNMGYYGKYMYFSPYYAASYIGAEDEATNPKRIDQKMIPGLLSSLGITSAKNHTQEKKTRSKETNPKNTTPLKTPVGGGGQNVTSSIRPPTAKAVLRWEDTDGSPKKLVLREGDNILIGRDRINDISILSRHVSRRHAVITWRKNLFEVADLGSTNGTMVNGTLIETPTELKYGDTIRLFDIELLFEDISPTGPVSPAPGEVENLAEAGNQISPAS